MIAILQDIVNQIRGMGPEALTVGTVIGIGYFFRVVPIDNKWIPALCVLVGPVCYVLIGSTTDVKFTTRNPEVVLAMFGLLWGVLGWALHHLVIWHVEQWIKNKFGKQRRKNEKTVQQFGVVPGASDLGGSGGL